MIYVQRSASLAHSFIAWLFANRFLVRLFPLNASKALCPPHRGLLHLLSLSILLLLFRACRYMVLLLLSTAYFIRRIPARMFVLLRLLVLAFRLLILRISNGR